MKKLVFAVSLMFLITLTFNMCQSAPPPAPKPEPQKEQPKEEKKEPAPEVKKEEPVKKRDYAAERKAMEDKCYEQCITKMSAEYCRCHCYEKGDCSKYRTK